MPRRAARVRKKRVANYTAATLRPCVLPEARFIQKPVKLSAYTRVMAGKKLFTRLTECASRASGHPTATILATLIVIVWAATGPLFHYSDTWQLVINTFTTLVTFMMVFLIQSSQNRDTAALQIKLDEVIRVLKRADNSLLSLEKLDDCELQRIQAKYDQLAQIARSARPGMHEAENEEQAT